jgi:hypothetical protein
MGTVITSILAVSFLSVLIVDARGKRREFLRKHGG